jgi:hypothetical protein
MSEQLTIQEILAAITVAVEKNDTAELKVLKEEYGTILGVEAMLDGLLQEHEPELMEKYFPSLLEVVSFDSGGEGSAEDSPEIVYNYKPTDQLFGKGGWYQSYHGTDWDEGGWKEFEKVPTFVYREKAAK